MNLDVRLPIGMLFSVLGAMLVAYGFVVEQGKAEKYCPVNLDLWWGLAMLAFGCLMLALALWKKKKTT